MKHDAWSTAVRIRKQFTKYTIKQMNGLNVTRNYLNSWWWNIPYKSYLFISAVGRPLWAVGITHRLLIIWWKMAHIHRESICNQVICPSRWWMFYCMLRLLIYVFFLIHYNSHLFSVLYWLFFIAYCYLSELIRMAISVTRVINHSSFHSL